MFFTKSELKQIQERCKAIPELPLIFNLQPFDYTIIQEAIGDMLKAAVMGNESIEINNVTPNSTEYIILLRILTSMRCLIDERINSDGSITIVASWAE